MDASRSSNVGPTQQAPSRHACDVHTLVEAVSVGKSQKSEKDLVPCK